MLLVVERGAGGQQDSGEEGRWAFDQSMVSLEAIYQSRVVLKQFTYEK